MSLAAALGECTTKPDNVVKVDKWSSPTKFDVICEEYWGGLLKSNPEVCDASDISGRQETGCRAYLTGLRTQGVQQTNQ